MKTVDARDDLEGGVSCAGHVLDDRRLASRVG